MNSTPGWIYHPPFPKTWTRRRLLSLAHWANGLAFRDIQFSSAAEGGKPVIKIAEIKSGISKQTKYTTQIFDDAVRVRAGDLLFSWSGQPESSIDAHWWRGPEGWLNQHVFRVTPVEGVDTTFFHHLLRYLKPHFVAIARNKQTTGLGHVTRQDLENMIVAVPSLAEQRAIGYVLGALDDKIDLNRRIAAVPVAVNQGFIAMVCERRVPNLYVLFWCYRNLDYVRSIASGTTFAEISKRAFRPLPVIVPPAPLLTAWTDLVRPLYDRMVTSARQCESLTGMRELLLPRLMSGGIRIADAGRAGGRLG